MFQLTVVDVEAEATVASQYSGTMLYGEGEPSKTALTTCSSAISDCE